jgi:hypothetical protein
MGRDRDRARAPRKGVFPDKLCVLDHLRGIVMGWRRDTFTSKAVVQLLFHF